MHRELYKFKQIKWELIIWKSYIDINGIESHLLDVNKHYENTKDELVTLFSSRLIT